MLYAKVLGYPSVKKIFWSFFRDTNGFFGTGADASGLVHHDFSRKPAFDHTGGCAEHFNCCKMPLTYDLDSIYERAPEIVAHFPPKR